MEAPKESPQSFTTNKSRSPSGCVITSLSTIRIKNWFVRVSTTSFDTICVVMCHVKTEDTRVAFFIDEIHAHNFIKAVTSDDV